MRTFLPVAIRWALVPALFLSAACAADRTVTIDGSQARVVVSAVSPVPVGATRRLTARLIRGAETTMVSGASWATSNASIAMISDGNLLTAVAGGTTRITATYDGLAASADVQVVPPTPAVVASVRMQPSSVTLAVGATATLVATPLDAANQPIAGRTVTWSSASDAIATVAAGAVTGRATGSTTVRATVDGVVGTAAVTVEAAPVAAIDVTLAATSITVGQQTSASAVTRDGSGNLLTGRAVTWTTSNSAVATVDGTGVVRGIAAGTAVITGTSEGRGDGETITVTPPVAGGWPNEPATHTLIVDRPFAAREESGWTFWGYGGWPNGENFTITEDATAPQSAGSVGTMRFPAGFPGGEEPALTAGNTTGSPTTLYIGFWVKFSQNWVGHNSCVNKIFHIWIGDANRVYLAACGSGSGALEPQVRLQGVVNYGGADNLGPNLVPGTQIVRGRWQRWETVLRANTGGNADGTADFYIDGVHVGHYTGIQYVTSAQGHTWDYVQWGPTYGGTGGSVATTQYQYIDHLRLSGRR